MSLSFTSSMHVAFTHLLNYIFKFIKDQSLEINLEDNKGKSNIDTGTTIYSLIDYVHQSHTSN